MQLSRVVVILLIGASNFDRIDPKILLSIVAVRLKLVVLIRRLLRGIYHSVVFGGVAESRFQRCAPRIGVNRAVGGQSKVASKDLNTDMQRQ